MMKNNELTREGQGRQSNMELLRIVCILSVITLHFCNNNPNAFAYIADVSQAGYFLFRVIYSFAIIAVDVFLMISGYFMTDRNEVKLGKVLNLFLVILLYNFLISIGRVAFGSGEVSVRTFIWRCVPRNYYVYMYIAVYLLSPFINRAVRGLSKKQYALLLGLSVFLFSIWNTAVNLLSGITGKTITGMFTVAQTTTDRGFNLIIFILMYLFGGYIRRFGLFRNKKSLCFGIAAACILITSVSNFCLSGFDALLNYDSIFVILQAAAIFVIFTQIHLQSKFVNRISKATYGTYLLHSVGLAIMIRILPVADWLTGSTLTMIAAWVVIVFGAYFLSVLADTVRRGILFPLAKRWQKCRLYNLSVKAS